MSFTAQASLALRSKNFSPLRATKSAKKLVNFSQQQLKSPHSNDLISYEDVNSIIPTDVTEADNGSNIGSKIFQKSAKRIMDSSFIKNSFLFRAAKKMENSAQMGVSIKEANTNPAEENIEHKFNFNIEAFKQEACIKYTGYVDSKIEYKAGENTLNVSFEEKLSENSKIALTHQNNPIEQKQFLQYELTF